MGLVASQARLLMSFARKSDIEYRAQVVCNRRMRLSFETSEVARVYADKLSNVTSAGVAQAPTAPAPTQQVQTTQGSAGNTSPLTSISLDELTQANLNLYESSTNYRVYNMDSSSIINGLENGSLYLKYINPPAGADPNAQIVWGGGTVTTLANEPAQSTNWPTPPDQPPASQGNNRLYTEDDAEATAIYEAQTAILQAEDKRLEMELKNLETQQKAISTEIDSIQKVIDKNIEKSFKVFG